MQFITNMPSSLHLKEAFVRRVRAGEMYGDRSLPHNLNSPKATQSSGKDLACTLLTLEPCSDMTHERLPVAHL